MRYPNLVLAGVLALAFIQPAQVPACQCLTIAAAPATPKASKATLRRLFKEMERTSEFFVGTVVATAYVNIPRPEASSDQLYLVATLEVEEHWFGEHAWRKEVYTSGHSTACGVIFEVGQKYIVSGDLISHSELKESEFPKTAAWTDSCQTKRFTSEEYQERTEPFRGYASPWRPHAKRISLEP